MSVTQPSSLPPHNLTAEKSVLGAVLLDERHMHALIELQLKPDHFYRPEHRAVFEAMLALYNRDGKIDRRKIHLEDPIRHTGTYMVVVEVTDEVTATVKTMVVPA